MTVLDRIPVDRITAQAREIHFWRTVLTLVAGLLYGVGWVALHTFAGLWFVLTWCGAAVKVGWADARTSRADRSARGRATPA